MAARASSAARYAADVPTYSSVGSACPDQMRIAHRAESLESSAPAFPPPPCDLQIRSSRPAELHRQPLTEPSVRLSPHSAPSGKHTSHPDLPMYKDIHAFRRQPL